MHRSILPILLAVAAGPALAQDGEERLVQAPLPGFELGHRAARGPISIEEWVPSGESVEQWTRLVTTQRFGGVVDQVPPRDLLERMVAGLGQTCPGAVAGPVRAFEVAGRPAAELRADCPLNPTTGLPETFFARAIGGAADLHVVQVAFRRPPTAEDSAWARAHLDSVVLCGADAAEPACRSD